MVMKDVEKIINQDGIWLIKFIDVGKSQSITILYWQSWHSLTDNGLIYICTDIIYAHNDHLSLRDIWQKIDFSPLIKTLTMMHFIP